MIITPYQSEHQAAVIELWNACGLVKPWNDPSKDIERKVAHSPELFLVGLVDGKVVGTVMGGYDGHRGWINYLAVNPDAQQTGLGRALMQAVERLLLAQGCPKINLQVRSTNTQVITFYEKLGYQDDQVLGLGKRLIDDE
ncbi:GNAT family acetyltransferase [Vibrio tritonius]|uniref:GNAT family acetyltransferase n=1 Tax=Vibrio tritonius TaxID=1435069 RepID=UPI0008396792|nr:GNAT family acetyltransferase [Vibrio tritonius]